MYRYIVASTNRYTPVNKTNIKQLLKMFRASDMCTMKCNDKYVKFTWDDGAYLTKYYSIDDIIDALNSNGISYEEICDSPQSLIYNDTGLDELARCSARYSFEMPEYRKKVHMYNEQYGLNSYR